LDSVVSSAQKKNQFQLLFEIKVLQEWRDVKGGVGGGDGQEQKEILCAVSAQGTKKKLHQQKRFREILNTNKSICNRENTLRATKVST
jgi:hypothetical protein